MSRSRCCSACSACGSGTRSADGSRSERAACSTDFLRDTDAMITEEIKVLLRTPKFRRFSVHLTDGSKHSVPHPDYAWLTPNNAVLYVFENNAGQRISVAEIARIETSADAPLGT